MCLEIIYRLIIELVLEDINFLTPCMDIVIIWTKIMCPHHYHYIHYVLYLYSIRLKLASVLHNLTHFHITTCIGLCIHTYSDTCE